MKKYLEDIFNGGRVTVELIIQIRCFIYGKIEVRAKSKKAQGSWPAILMMPELPTS